MLITIHAAVGFSIGALVGDPYSAAPLALASHYLLDGLPHFEVSSFRKPQDRGLKPRNLFELIFVLLDLFAAAGFIFVFRNRVSFSTLTGAAFGVLPDVLDNVFLWSPFIHRLPVFRQLYSFHKSFHQTTRGRRNIVGIITQLFWLALAVALLRFSF